MKTVRIGLWKCLVGTAALFCAAAAGAQPYEFRVVARDLSRPVGIAVESDRTLLFTQVPTPGVMGGANGVFRLDLASGDVTTLHVGEPEPLNLALGAEGDAYWTCRTAGVILKRNSAGQTTLFLSELEKPTGIAVDRRGVVYFTEVPNPGVAMAGNRVSVSDGSTTQILHMGEPEPTDVVVSKKGEIYWTCKSAGVILEQVGGETKVLLSGLDHPSGIALDKNGNNLYFTEVPTPGIAGNAGGRNRVWRLELKTGEQTLVHFGDPEPTDVAVAHNGNVYWTCTSAGVIVEASPN